MNVASGKGQAMKPQGYSKEVMEALANPETASQWMIAISTPNSVPFKTARNLLKANKDGKKIPEDLLYHWAMRYCSQFGSKQARIDDFIKNNPKPVMNVKGVDEVLAKDFHKVKEKLDALSSNQRQSVIDEYIDNKRNEIISLYKIAVEARNESAAIIDEWQTHYQIVKNKLTSYILENKIAGVALDDTVIPTERLVEVVETVYSNTDLIKGFLEKEYTCRSKEMEITLLLKLMGEMLNVNKNIPVDFMQAMCAEAAKLLTVNYAILLAEKIANQSDGHPEKYQHPLLNAMQKNKALYAIFYTMVSVERENDAKYVGKLFGLYTAQVEVMNRIKANEYSICKLQRYSL